MNVKKLIAIALTLLVVVPIGAGFALALEKEDRTVFERDSGTSISDVMYNHWSHTLVDSLDPINNSRITATGPSGAGITPAYVNVSSKPTAYPDGHGAYGDVSYGWKLVSGYPVWNNALGTGYMEIYLDLGTSMSAGDVFKLAHGVAVDLSSSIGYENLTITKKASGDLSVHFGKPSVSGGSTQTLGEYRYLRVTIDSVSNTTTVDGLLSWPAYGTSPMVINSVSWSKILIDDWGPVSLWSQGNNAAYRVDLCKVFGESYPDTRNYTLDPTVLFPDLDLDIVLNGANVYGTGLSIGGTANFFSVTDGKITVDGKEIGLRGATIRILRDGVGVYDLFVNGHKVADDVTTPTIYFWNTWSASVSAYKLTERTDKVTVWHAGEFGLDRTGIAAVGLLVCGGLLVGLGMTGPRSGVKIGALLLICGGAAIVYLMLI